MCSKLHLSEYYLLSDINRYTNQAVERQKFGAKTQDIAINKLKLIIWVQILYYSFLL